MARPKQNEVLRHETTAHPAVKKRVTTQRNLVAPRARPDDDADTFGTIESEQRMQTFEMRESTVVSVPPRDRTPKGVTDGRGKRSVKDVLLSHPTPEGKMIYALERIASAEDTIVKILELMGPEARELAFKRRPTLRQYWEE